MAKNSNYTISEKAQSIIKSVNPYNNWSKYNWIISSLYALRENNDAEIVRILNPDIDGFKTVVSPEERGILLAEYENVVRFCHDKAKNANLEIYGDVVYSIDGTVFGGVGPQEIPSSLVDFCTKAVGPEQEDSTFIPFAGRCEFAFAFGGKCFGYEISREVWAFDKILLEALHIDMELENVDVLCLEQPSSVQFDNIVSVPPFLRGKDEKRIADFFLSLLMNNLKDGGAMCMVLPIDATYSRVWQQFREYLLNNSGSYLSAIISLPAVFLPETNVKCCMFLIEKSTNPNKDVYIFEADGQDFQYSTERDSPRLSLRTETMLEAFSIQDERFVKVVSADSVVSKGKDCLLRPSLFFIEKVLPSLKPGEHYVELRDLVSMVVLDMDYSTLFSENPMGTEKYIRFSSLSDNYLACRIDLSKIPEAPVRNKSIVTEEAGYYVSYLNGVVRVGYIPARTSEKKQTEKEAWHEALWGDERMSVRLVGIDENVFHFRVKTGGEALPDYIMRELLSDYVVAQAKRLSHGSVRSVLNAKDFLQLIIVVPPLDEQEKILEQDRMAAFQEANQQIDELNEKFRKDIHMMKHGLGQTVFNLRNWIQVLNIARQVGGGVLNDDTEIGGLKKIKTATVFNNIDSALKVLSRQIQTFDVGFGMKESPFAIADFIDEYIETHPRPGMCYIFESEKYRADMDVPWPTFAESRVDSLDVSSVNPKDAGHFLIKKGDPFDYVSFPKEALTVILDNIVSNAVSHGFSNSEKQYSIRFEIEPKGEDVILLVSNNGDPLPEGIKPGEVFIWGHTSDTGKHTGIGGYQICDLMERFSGKGKAELISTPSEEYTVTYKLTFRCPKSSVIGDF